MGTATLTVNVTCELNAWEHDVAFATAMSRGDAQTRYSSSTSHRYRGKFISRSVRLLLDRPVLVLIERIRGLKSLLQRLFNVKAFSKDFLRKGRVEGEIKCIYRGGSKKSIFLFYQLDNSPAIFPLEFRNHPERK